MTIPEEIALEPSCYECGMVLAYIDMESYAIDGERVLCFRCATRRGGTYNEAEGHWTAHPDIHDLVRSSSPVL